MTPKPHSRLPITSLAEAQGYIEHLEEQLEVLRKAAVDAEALLTQGTGDEHCAYALGTLRKALSNPAKRPT